MSRRVHPKSHSLVRQLIDDYLNESNTVRAMSLQQDDAPFSTRSPKPRADTIETTESEHLLVNKYFPYIKELFCAMMQQKSW